MEINSLYFSNAKIYSFIVIRESENERKATSKKKRKKIDAFFFSKHREMTAEKTKERLQK